jgi:hypothetical protein
VYQSLAAGGTVAGANGVPELAARGKVAGANGKLGFAVVGTVSPEFLLPTREQNNERQPEGMLQL